MRRRALGLLLAAVLITVPSSTVTDDDIIAAIQADRGDALPVVTILQDVADARAPQIVTDFSHYGPGADAARSPLSGWSWGEIIAWNNYPDAMTVEAAIQAWDGSPDHASILHGRWAGFGAAVDMASNGAHYYVAIFGTPPSAPRPAPTPTPRPRPVYVPRPSPRPSRTAGPSPTPTPSPAPTGWYPGIRYRDRATPA